MDNFNIRLSKFNIVLTYTMAVAIVAGPYLIKGPSTYLTFFDDGLGRIILYAIHAFLISLMIHRCFFIYRAFSAKPYVEFLDEKIIVRLRKEEIFNIKDYKFIIATREHQRILISDDTNKPIFSIPSQYLKQKYISAYIDKINRKYQYQYHI